MIIVCDNYKKDELLSKNNKLSNVKYMNKIEFIHKFYFDYDKHAIYELCKYYGFNYENSKMYLDNIYYIEDKYYGVEKLDKLVSIKRYLDSNKLLIYDNLFREYLKNNEVVFDSVELDKFDNIMIKELDSITSIKVIEKDSKPCLEEMLGTIKDILGETIEKYRYNGQNGTNESIIISNNL